MGNRPPRNDSGAVGAAVHAGGPVPNRPVGETQQFMNNFFQQNEDLGLFGLIAPTNHPNHRRVKAHANKTKALDIPFDIVQGTLNLGSVSKEAPIWQLKFTYDSTEEIRTTVWLDPVEKRSNDEYNLVEEVKSSSCLPNVQPGHIGKGCNQTHTLEIDLNTWLASHEAATAKNIDPDSAACMLMIIMESKEPPVADRKAISRVYLYYRVDKLVSSDSSQPPVAFVLEKKAIQYGRRFLWLKNIYDHTSATADPSGSGPRGSASSEDQLCTVCYTNPTNTVVMPCRHFCLCLHCSKELKRRFHK